MKKDTCKLIIEDRFRNDDQKARDKILRGIILNIIKIGQRNFDYTNTKQNH